MSEKPQRLSEILDTFAPEGANDRRWHFIEHQLEQTVISARSVVGSLHNIAAAPENEAERMVAEDCLTYLGGMLRYILGEKASLQAYLSDTDVPERISRKEL